MSIKEMFADGSTKNFDEFKRDVEAADGTVTFNDTAPAYTIVLDGEEYTFMHYAYCQIFFYGWLEGMKNTCAKM